MKKILISFLLTLSLLLNCFSIPVYAANSYTSYTNWEVFTTDDGFTIETKNSSIQIEVKTYTPEGNLFSHTIVNNNSGKVITIDAGGHETISYVDDYVEAVNYDDENQSKMIIVEPDPILQGLNDSETSAIKDDFNIQALIDEPVTDSGLQDSVYGDGYKFLGSSSVWYCSHPGYLFRKISSMTKHESHKFTFTAGTAVSTILGVVLSVFTGGAWTVAAIIGIISTSGGLLVDYFRGTFDYRTYHYLYRVRVRAAVWFTTHRNISYWTSYSDYSNTYKFKQKSFNYGFSQANFEMVKAGIDKYMEANP